MKTHTENIGHDPITQGRAQAALGDPRAFTPATRSDAGHRVTLKSRYDGRPRQATFYFNDKNL